jgi:hypothetical protein
MAGAPPQLKGTHYRRLTLEHNMNYVPVSFKWRASVVVRAVAEEALALASLTLFLATVAVWAQVLGVL